MSDADLRRILTCGKCFGVSARTLTKVLMYEACVLGLLSGGCFYELISL